MPQQVVPMLHVPDVQAAVEWYTSIGFHLVRHNEADGEVDWALLRLGDSELMFDGGGQASMAHRRELDFYIHTGPIDELYAKLKDRIRVVEAPHDTFYGMREFIIRDLNGFWITFGEPVAATPPR